MINIDLEYKLFPYFWEIHHEYEKMKKQKKETCGVYALTYILRGMGYNQHDGHELTESYLASLARVNLSQEDASRYWDLRCQVNSGKLKVGEISEEDLEVWYGNVYLPVADDLAEVGTSVEGVKVAAETASNGEIEAIPIPSNENEFTEKMVSEILGLFLKSGDEFKSQIILNYKTDKCLQVDHCKYSLFNLICQWDNPDFFPLETWSVGHFVSVGGEVRINRSEKPYYIIRDTKIIKGFQGYHFQPLKNLTKALLRDDGREGGILALIDKNYGSTIRRRLEEKGLTIRLWDNGSPFKKKQDE